MPYKSNKMDFGNNKENIDTEIIHEHIQRLTLALNLEYSIVGVKLLQSEDDYLKNEFEELKGKAAYCQMVKQGAQGGSSKSTIESHSCDGGTTALALESSNPRIESGEEYFSYNLYNTRSAARRMRRSITSLDYNTEKNYGVAVGALEKFVSVPDVLIIVCNAYQAMRLMQGYSYCTGEKTSCDIGAMQALCSELTVVPLVTGKINLSVFCPSTRMLCKWNDDQMAVGIPFEKFYDVVDGVFGTMQTTDSKEKKKEIIDRFKSNNITIDLDIKKGY